MHNFGRLVLMAVFKGEDSNWRISSCEATLMIFLSLL